MATRGALYAWEFEKDGHALNVRFDGRLVAVLEDWSPPFSRNHLYYPDRHNLSQAFRVVVDELVRRRQAADK